MAYEMRPVVDTIAPRHFEQTAELCGLSPQTTKAIIEELLDAGNSKIDGTLQQLPKAFPEAIATSIGEAAKRRLTRLIPDGDRA